MNRRTFAIGLAFAGLTTAVTAMGWTWSRLLSTGHSLFPTRVWPLPALYLVEAVVLPGIVLWAVLVTSHRKACVGAWLAVGALATMALLGALSIGLYVALSLIFLVPAVVVGDEGRSTVSRQLAAFVLGGLLQAGIMIGVIYFFRPPMSGGG